MQIHIGFGRTLLLGIIGSILGGFFAQVFSKPSNGRLFHPAGLIMSIVGAIVVLFIGSFVHF